MGEVGWSSKRGGFGGGMAGGSSRVPSRTELTETESVCSEEVDLWAK